VLVLVHRAEADETLMAIQSDGMWREPGEPTVAFAATHWMPLPEAP